MLSIEEEHLGLIRSLLSASALGDWDKVRGLFHQDISIHFPGRNPLAGDYFGMEEASGLLARLSEWTDNSMRLDVHDVLANEQHGVLMYSVSATHSDKSIKYRYVDIYHFRDGEISEVWGQVVTDVRDFDEFYGG